MDTDGIESAISAGIGTVVTIGMAGIALKAASNLVGQGEQPKKTKSYEGVKAPKAPKLHTLKVPKFEVPKVHTGTKSGKIPKVPEYGSKADYFSPNEIMKRQRGE